jgi:cation:H+ antiporter
MGRFKWVIVALVATLPGVYLSLTGSHIDPVLASLIYGLAIVGASFMLAWGAEVAQHDIPQALALTILALIAVLPEYAVDMYFAFQAGRNPGSNYGELALANMTGANRLLVGLAWPVVIFVYWLSSRRRGIRVSEVQLDEGQGVELIFLGAATIYSFLLPLKADLSIFDMLILVTLFGLYAWRASQAHVVEPELIGPAKALGELPPRPRRWTTVGLFAAAGIVIYLVAEHFAEALIETGTALGIDEFFLVQWLAPLASESPEFIITAMFAWRLQAAAGMGALVSSKVNQWTLLVGTLPLVYSLGAGRIAELELSPTQQSEVLLTAAQSFFAVAVISNLRISVMEAGLLLALFLGQFFIPGSHGFFTIAYLVLGVVFLFRHRRHFLAIGRGVMTLGRRQQEHGARGDHHPGARDGDGSHTIARGIGRETSREEATEANLDRR